MKSIASFVLAAVVSANYCYEDGCNCNGEVRACYSLPRQNMQPKAINTCCAEGDMPTIYGFDNGRSKNITPVTDSLWSNAKQQEMAIQHMQGGSSTTESQTASLRWNEWKCVNYCVQFGNYPPGVSKCPKFGDCAEHIAATQVTASLRDVNKKNDSWNGNTFTGANVKTGGNTNCGANCGITVNVNKLNHAMSGGSSATWSPTASLAWNADKCSSYCATFGSYPPTKCERYGPCEAQEEAAPEVTASLNWTNTRCRDYCQTTGAYPPMGCGQMTSPLSPYVEPCVPLATTASLLSKEHKEKMGKTDGSWNPRDSLDKKNGNWNGNTFTGANVETGGNTNCIKGCGIEVNLNNSL